MQALAESGAGEIAALCEPDPRRLDAAIAALDTEPALCGDFDELLDEPLDGIVIATPNALHAPQAAAALERGIAVFCQKPLALTAKDTVKIVELARRHDLPLGVDWSYRFLAGVPELKCAIARAELGTVTAAELCFHNAYGPDAGWYYDVARSGGGCLLDLGCHLLDLCHWLLGAGEPQTVNARCFSAGRRLEPPVACAEDFVIADVLYAGGVDAHLSCSWRASAGRGAIIGCRIFGTEGGAAIRNVAGSFYDFEVELCRGAESVPLAAPPDAWPGRALIDWARRVGDGEGCDPDTAHLITTARVIDRIYGREAGDGAA
ncbi:MAG: Gfo/Idh/MocA family oxidoreductase [Gammaproteobacteria bacterium]|nr:Gfo/Idh/MocA family oxidoreductase [Gammaproteobacteria bacterium]